MGGIGALIGGAFAALVGAVLIWSFLFERWIDGRWPADGRFVETCGYRLQVREAGSGGPVLLIHGAGGSAREIMTLIGDRLAAHTRVIAMDRPGFGGSPAMGGRDRLGRHADAVAALIEAEGLERPVVVGHSYGGAVALRLALDHPGAASGLVLLGTASHGDVGPVARYNHVAAAPLIGPAFCRLVPTIIGPLVMAGGIRRTFAPDTAPPSYATDAGVALLMRPRTFCANARDLDRVNRELREQSERYGEIALPVALIAGGRDITVLTSGHSERLARALPNARLAIIPHAGHMPHHTEPELVVEHVLAILETRG